MSYRDLLRRYQTVQNMSGAPTMTDYVQSGGGSGNWESIAQDMAMNQYGYTPKQWNMLDYIIERESGWNPNALNESSGAYGIPQILPKAHPGVNLQNDPMGQLRWLFNYINSPRYGGIEGAYQHKLSTGWY